MSGSQAPLHPKRHGAQPNALAIGAGVNAPAEDGRTALMHAVLASDFAPEMVRFLLRSGAEVAACDTKRQVTTPPK